MAHTGLRNELPTAAVTSRDNAFVHEPQHLEHERVHTGRWGPMTDAEDDAEANPWDELLEDAQSLAENYREAGWEAIVVRPTDVLAVDRGERPGLEALVTDDEYDPVAAAVDREEATFDRAEVYRRQAGENTHVLTVEADDATETAIVLPLTYTLEDAREVLETALDAGVLEVHVRPPALEDGWVSFAHDEPSLFVEDDRL